ncbi:MAG: cellulose synthase subunit BcsC-related outer membrane protein [Bryobacteraceae bacterium]
MKRHYFRIAHYILWATLTAGSVWAGSPATDLLLNKARSLEGRGRLDLAAQTWQQILLTDPNEPEALAGLARSAKQNGKLDEAKGYLERLRKINPNHPAIAQVESMKVIGQQRARLDEARRLARNQQFEQAMQVYREVFGNEPPPGGWAIAYYETEAATPGGWETATAALHKLTQKYPQSQEYRLSLGRLWTYRPQTRQAGMRLLESVEGSSVLVNKARQAWRQALVWEGAHPRSNSSLRSYLSRYPDTELQKNLERTPKPETKPGLAQGPEEQLAYNSLNAGDLKEAESRFKAVLETSPQSVGALAGLGFVRMKQKDFAAALKHLESAKALAPQNKIILEAIETSQFWKQMNAAAAAFTGDRLAEARSFYNNALAMQPGSVEALQGLAGTLMKLKETAEAARIFERLLEAQPDNVDAWRDLVSARYQAEGGAAALAAAKRVPEPVQPALAKDTEYLALLASAHSDAGQMEEAVKLLDQARELVASGKKEMPVPMKLQFAGLYLSQGRAAQAEELYQQVTDSHPDNLVAWEGLVAALIRMKEEARAFAAMQRMPKDAYDAAIERPGFLRSAASIQAKFGRLDLAEALLQRVLQEGSASGPEVSTQLQLANVWLQQGQTEKAEKLLQEIAASQPENADVWKMRIVALHQAKRDREALAEIRRMPASVSTRLQGDADFGGLLAAVYNATGEYEPALRLTRATISRLEQDKQQVPAGLMLQLAWLLLDREGDERELYSLLTTMGARRDLTPEHQSALSEIWSVWGRRRADAAKAAGDLKRSIAILEASARMLPKDLRLRASLAGALLEDGNTKSALAVYKSWGLSGANAADYSGAIGAALAERDPVGAIWLQSGLKKWPADHQLLSLAGQHATDKGDYKKAEMYWRLALSAMSAQSREASAEASTTVPDPLKPDEDPRQSLGRLLLEDSGIPAGDPALFQPGQTVLNGDPLAPYTPLESKGISVQTDRPQATGNPGSKTGLAPEEPLIPRPLPSMDERSQHTPPQISFAKFNTALYEPPSLIGPKPQKSKREKIEDQLSAIQGRNTPYFGSGGALQSRSGQAGFERRILQEVDLETSTTIADRLRLSLIARPVYIDSGAGDGQSELRFGLLPSGATFGSQAASGLGAEAQLSTHNFGLRFGSTPQGFLVKNLVGSARFRPGGGPITLLLNRDSIKDTMLSYAGTRDPVSNQIWGGVVANTVSVQGNWGKEAAGFYASLGYQTITGRQVANNKRMDGNMGTYLMVMTRPEGSLTLGLNLTAMHYEKNLRFFTLGHGGYFSPQRYYLLNVPAQWKGSHNQWQYSISGSLGSQHFQEDASPYFPASPALQRRTGPYYPQLTSTGANYSLDARGLYQLSPNWYLGGFLNFNNARNFSAQTVGFSVKYLFRPRPLDSDVRIPELPDWKGAQPFQLP